MSTKSNHRWRWCWSRKRQKMNLPSNTDFRSTKIITSSQRWERSGKKREEKKDSRNNIKHLLTLIKDLTQANHQHSILFFFYPFFQLWTVWRLLPLVVVTNILKSLGIECRRTKNCGQKSSEGLFSMFSLGVRCEGEGWVMRGSRQHRILPDSPGTTPLVSRLWSCSMNTEYLGTKYKIQ